MSEPISHIEKLMASEGLLGINLWSKIELETIIGWAKNESEDPYLLKNVLVILGQAYPDEARKFLHELDRSRQHPIVYRAIHYVLTKPIAENLVRKAEPDVLRKYRAKFYPTIEELLGEAESYDLVS